MERERPDFEIVDDHGSIGVEVTEAVLEEYRRVRRLLRHNVMIPTNLQYREKGRRRSNDELVRDATDLSKMGLTHSEYMQHWFLPIQNQVIQKRKKLNEATYQKFDRNWLFILDQSRLLSDDFTVQSVDDILIQFFRRASNAISRL